MSAYSLAVHLSGVLAEHNRKSYASTTCVHPDKYLCDRLEEAHKANPYVSPERLQLVRVGCTGCSKSHPLPVKPCVIQALIDTKKAQEEKLNSNLVSAYITEINYRMTKQASYPFLWCITEQKGVFQHKDLGGHRIKFDMTALNSVASMFRELYEVGLASGLLGGDDDTQHEFLIMGPKKVNDSEPGQSSTDA